MYCKHCGKQLSDEAFMCPECGCPTGAKASKRTSDVPAASKVQTGKALAVIGFVFAAISFVTGIIFGSFLFVFSLSGLILYVLGATTILPALASIAMGIYDLFHFSAEESKTVRALAITGIVLAGFTLFFLFISACVLIGIY